jgi:hypothetical protein
LEQKNPYGDLAMEDIIDTASDFYTRIVDSELIADEILSRDRQLKYKYSVSINLEKAK